MTRRAWRAASVAASVAVFLAAPLLAGAQAPAPHPYPDADLAVGQKLLREHACAACHVRKVGGDGSAIYRPAGRINTPAALLSMVERCNTELSLQLFPEDVASIAAVLHRDHYRFAARPAAAKP
jgi:mono/diheme cytochrome c family protein